MEDLSTNIDIICNLDRQLHPLYWNITGKVYELYSVPAIFTTTSPEAITLASVNRRMNGWILFCFSVGVGVGHSVIAGATTVLHVIYGMYICQGSEGATLVHSHPLNWHRHNIIIDCVTGIGNDNGSTLCVALG